MTDHKVSAESKHYQSCCVQILHKITIWLVGCFGFNGPLRQYFSLYGAVSQREGERIEKR